MKKIMKNKTYLISLFLIALVSLAFRSGDGGKNTTFKGNVPARDSYRLFINNISIPLNRIGVLGDVSIGGSSGGRLDGKEFLYSGGFFLSGKTNGIPWANAVASASRITDYEQGTYKYGTNDPRNQLFVLEQNKGDFNEQWEDWKEAVELGAYFYDGDGDGKYNPVDLNGNGKWDPTEDRPDLIGDATVWCVYKDSKSPALRRFNDVDPQGIEVRQTVFAFASKGIVGNMIFIRYSLLNTGSVADTLDDVYFGVWADPDLGNVNDAYLDDLVGCDTTLNAGYVYNDGDDNEWGQTPPCFLMDFFQGPIAYVPGKTFVDNNGNGIYDAGDTPLDTAINVQGQVRGIAKFPGAMNEGLSSFVHYMQSHPTHGDPNTQFEARNYMLGLNRVGQILDPCTWGFGQVRGGVNCAQVNPLFSYSGDPVTNTGWINNFPTDQRLMSNTGPFKMIKNVPVDIVVAYVVGRGTDALNSITVAKQYDLLAQLVFDSNFPSPPAPPQVKYDVKNGSDFIDINFKTDEQVNYVARDSVLDIERRLQGYYVTAFRTRSKEPSIQGIPNSTVIAEFQVDNFIKNVYQVAGNGGKNLAIKEVDATNKLSPSIYGNPNTGRMRVRINKDPFDGGPLIKGHEYYFTITHYYLNHRAIIHNNGASFGTPGDYYDPGGGAIEEFETQRIDVVFGEDQYAPAYYGIQPEKTGPANGAVKALIVNNDALTGDQYTVEFFEDKGQAPGTPYAPFWRLKNNRTNAVLIDSSKVYDWDTTKYAGEVKEGIIVKVQPVEPLIGSGNQITYTPSTNRWFTTFRSDSGTGVFYVGRDISQSTAITIRQTANISSNYSRASSLRTVELRFGTNGKAYRYLNGFKPVGNPPAVTRGTSFIYAPFVTAAETTNTGIKKFGEGFVDVPFTAWVKDDKFKEERQLAVAFVEISAAMGGNPDGVWDPGTVTTPLGNEIILILDAPYDPNGANIVYTGGNGSYSGTNWPDIVRSYTLNDPAANADQKAIASSRLFNTLYAVSLKKRSETSTFTNGDILRIPVVTYPYTSADKFTFKTTAKGLLSEDDQRALFNKVNVFPNPLFGFNPATSYANTPPDEPFVTFSNLPEEVTIKIFSLAGTRVRTLTSADKSSPNSTFLRWNLKNEDGLRVASGLYIAVVESPKYGEKILKFSIIMPQKQIERY